ncbi:carotenoid oxygenase family protein [Maricaulis parjimensis]|uniref:carotenoid oxygenase family protein n=1 Tax=Maricaulis parjimensis TaxID=144023 RepID=UPI00193A3D8B|nr:carotenoid oxygenase family protein [Maricaulis parjimensis]
MALNRRHLLSLMAAGSGAAALPGLALANQPVDPVYAAFEAASREDPWTLGFTDAPSEGFDGVARRLHGRLPRGLAGVLHRNGPARFSRNEWRYRHWFDGDGMVHAWRLTPGRDVSHTARFVGTRKWQNEEAAGRFLVPTFGSNPPGSIGLRGPDDMNAANTSVMMLNGELMALWEGGSAWRLDPETLESRGSRDFHESLRGVPFSAHPKIDPDGTVWNFGQAASHDLLVLYQIGADGALRRAEMVDDIPGGMIHDFAVTDRSLVFLIGNLAFQRMQMPFLDSFGWDDSRGMRVVAIDKADWSRRRTWDMPPGFLFHVGGAWEDADGTIHVDAALSDDAEIATGHARDVMLGTPQLEHQSISRMRLITLHPDGRAEQSVFSDVCAEFPQVDPRYTGLARRFTWHVGWPDGHMRGATQLVQRDLVSGATQRFDFGTDIVVEEPLFIPNGDRAEEGEGWLVHTALNKRERATELHVFNARHIEDGPVTSWRLPYACPLGFHGCWRGV